MVEKINNKEIILLYKLDGIYKIDKLDEIIKEHSKSEDTLN